MIRILVKERRMIHDFMIHPSHERGFDDFFESD